MPVVTVIVPTYNRIKTLRRAVESILNQSHKDLELIVVDDGSTDDTEVLVKSLALSDNRLKYVKLGSNGGLCNARNTGILAASGEYIAFQDSDDEWLPEKLIKQVEAMSKLPEEVGLVYCLMYYITADSKNIPNVNRFMPDDADLYEKGLMYMFRGIPMQTCLFRREVFDKTGLFDENIKAGYEDTELLIRAAKYFKFFCMEEPLVNYYKTEGSLTSKYGKIADSCLYIFNKYYQDIRKNPRVRAAQYRRMGREFKKAGKRTQARKYKVKAWLFNFLGKITSTDFLK